MAGSDGGSGAHQAVAAGSLGGVDDDEVAQLILAAAAAGVSLDEDSG